jgi:CheY-like chemotaxis protein
VEVALESASRTGALDLDRSTVLVVDDDLAVLDGLSELRRNEGYTVVTAQDGRAALDHLRPGLRLCVEFVLKPPAPAALMDAIWRRCGEPIHEAG